MRELQEKVRQRVNPEEDNVRFSWRSQDAKSKTLTIGSELPQPPPDYQVI
jgi:CRISPR-associated protein Cas2